MVNVSMKPNGALSSLTDPVFRYHKIRAHPFDNTIQIHQ